ncbi:hypothetical protein llap_19546 [Limosa lapponica baueri]|uniref:Cohesin loading complex subunit SCC4 homolog n=1 Tax=Limosa lapponica baueri TaxID=1758121 RepID=A0A2I0T8M2_LIMLA|nr:hypothetical protein llap_19546 [Limosa lapponica baueri]
MHSMQAGYLEKAQKYTDKALMQLEKLKMLDCSPILSSFQVILLEHIIMCRLVTGHKATALQEAIFARDTENVKCRRLESIDGVFSRAPGSHILRVGESQDLNKACGNAMDAHEAAQMHQNFSQQLLQDHIEACSLPEHNLITWTDGPPPVQFQAQNGPTTSLASLL